MKGGRQASSRSRQMAALHHEAEALWRLAILAMQYGCSNHPPETLMREDNVGGRYKL